MAAPLPVLTLGETGTFSFFIEPPFFHNLSFSNNI